MNIFDGVFSCRRDWSQNYPCALVHEAAGLNRLNTVGIIHSEEQGYPSSTWYIIYSYMFLLSYVQYEVVHLFYRTLWMWPSTIVKLIWVTLCFPGCLNLAKNRSDTKYFKERMAYFWSSEECYSVCCQPMCATKFMLGQRSESMKYPVTRNQK